MGFLPTSSPRISDPTFSEKCATKLSVTIKRNKLQQGRISYQKWVDEFDKLLKQQNEPTIARVLDWYIGNIGKEYVPEAYSASSFYKKFNQIKSQCDKDVNVDAMELSPRQKKLLDKISAWTWDKVSRRLPILVQTSFDKYEAFRLKMKDLPSKLRDKAKSNPKDKHRLARLARIVDHLLNTWKITAADVYLVQWFDTIKTIINKGYELSPERMTWALTNPTFEDSMYSAVSSYCGNACMWDEVVKELLLS